MNEDCNVEAATSGNKESLAADYDQSLSSIIQLVPADEQTGISRGCNSLIPEERSSFTAASAEFLSHYLATTRDGARSPSLTKRAP